MLAMDWPAAPKKLSIFRRFSRRPSPEPITNDTVYNTAVRPPSRLRKTASQPIEEEFSQSPPLSPAWSKHDSVIDIPRSPSPHLTKDKKHRKGQTITYTQRVDIPQVVRERVSRGSSSSSSNSARVQGSAIPTKPFPAGPQARIRVTTWDVFLLPAQVHALYCGYQPCLMSDKWFIYSEGPDTMGKLKVHFHRSLTGTKVAELFLVMDVKGEGAGKIVGIKWNGGEDVGGRTNGDEARYLVRAIVQSVFGFDLED
ncbi:hypothetical protein HBI39_062620 [Parastagonospora nodorum]|nr:hypothetical protein HBI12_018930 [Parastagonospora nodorum]KAH5446886.1 hypothetical protein HBI47_020770 [Parastagonospora nodorum]KAH6311397.1 hypothetical protein HBI39_062620 [Parastagonospora nodorum]